MCMLILSQHIDLSDNGSEDLNQQIDVSDSRLESTHRSQWEWRLVIVNMSQHIDLSDEGSEWLHLNQDTEISESRSESSEYLRKEQILWLIGVWHDSYNISTYTYPEMYMVLHIHTYIRTWITCDMANIISVQMYILRYEYCCIQQHSYLRIYICTDIILAMSHVIQVLIYVWIYPLVGSLRT